ncbi:MAG TPA: SpoIIE family protein phosphatase [Solirubrobacteraceae bacterium]|nr:SpoIIE family protein phosphatase [Solirubrobacteraceae bacterium]
MTPGSARETVPEFLGRGGQVGRDLLNVDWAATPLGPIENWPRSLSTVVRVLLTSRFAMWMAYGPELTFLCNDAYRRDTLGTKYPWALGRPAEEVWAEIWPEIGPRIEAVLKTGEATWDESLMLILERSGYPEETYHTFSYSPLPDDEGRIAGMLCVVSEETKRLLGERRMATLSELGALTSGVREEPDFLAAAARALASNPHSLPFTTIYLFEPDGSVRRAAAAGIEHGHPAAPEQITAGRDAAAWPLAELEAGRPARIDLTLPRFGEVPTGGWDEPPEEGLLLPIPEPGHTRPYGFLLIGLNRYTPIDVDTDYRSFLDLVVQHLSAGISAARMYEAERQRAEQLEELDRAKTAFFSNVSHEFRTPLTLMLGPLEDAMAEAGGLDHSRAELVHRNALRLLKLVNALLDFSRAEAGRMRAEFRPTDLCRLTAELAGTFREATERAGLDLIIECNAPVENVYVDRDLWERIVLNLVSNAFKATLHGHIRVGLHAVPDGVELAVEDTGTGIPPEEIGRLFQRFHRVRSVARSYEGSGIGLALVKELTELHGGEVGVSSTLDEGSRFTVRLPLGSAHLPQDQVQEESIEPAASIAPLFVEEAMSWVGDRTVQPAAEAGEPSRLAEEDGAGVPRSRVLIADDNPDLRRYLTTLLSPQFEVEAVGDGEEALAVIRRQPPDLLISDVMMPRLDGYGLLGVLRSAPETQDLPVILLSARAGEEAAIEGLGAGADDYLPKPFSGRELLARVRAHVDLSSLRRQAAADLRAERRRLEQTLQQLPAGVVLAEGPSARIVLANQQAAEILGTSIRSANSIGEITDYRVLSMDGEPLTLEQRPIIRAVRAGETVDDEDLLYEAGDGRRIIIRVSAAPIRGDDGEIVAAVLVFQDVSRRVRSERLLAAQRDVLASIAGGESLAETLTAMTRTVEELSEYDARASILLLSADGRHLVHGAAPSLPDAYNAAIDGVAIGPAVGSCGTAAYRGETVAVTDTMVDPLWADFRALVSEHGLRACWSTPIRADDGDLVGTFAVYYGQPREPAAEDRRVVELLTRTAGVAIARARDAQNRARRLAELQSSLLPRALPAVPGIGAAVSFHPADRGLDVGGDFYDVFPLPDGGWGFVIGDVCGHGAGAAAVTGLTRHTTRAIARLQPSPARVLEVVNEELRASDHNRFCTAQYGRLDPTADGFRLTLASGGHPGPMIRRAEGKVEAVRVRGPLLGVFGDATFPESTTVLRAGDTLVLYTDGLVERNPRLAGEGALRRLLKSLGPNDVDELLADLERRALGSPPARLLDDAAVLALQVTGPVSGGAAAPESVLAAA